MDHNIHTAQPIRGTPHFLGVSESYSDETEMPRPLLPAAPAPVNPWIPCATRLPENGRLMEVWYDGKIQPAVYRCHTGMIGLFYVYTPMRCVSALITKIALWREYRPEHPPEWQ